MKVIAVLSVLLAVVGALFLLAGYYLGTHPTGIPEDADLPIFALSLGAPLFVAGWVGMAIAVHGLNRKV